jgi:hypothetical protein
MDPDIAQYQVAQWLEPSATRSRKAPMQRMHFVKRSMTRKAIMNPNRRVNMQCMQGEDDKFYYIPLDSYNPAHLSIIGDVSPLLVNPTPAQFEPGAMYTYIVASIITKDPSTNRDIEVVPAKLYATKALNMFEFGTKHHHILYRMASTPELDEVAARNAGVGPGMDLQYALHASGEIRCINERVLEFNFFSGTYKMQRKIPKRRAKYETALITHLMQTIAPSYTIAFDFKPFIVPDVMRITHAQMADLKRKGIPAFGFDTQAQCRTMRISVLRHKNVEGTDMTHERMNEAYASIVDLAPPPPPPPPPASSAFSASSAGPSTRPSMPLQAMSRTELQNLATSLNLTLPEHILTLPERERRVPLIEAISAHYKSFNPAGKGGKKIRTLKKRKSNRCNLL